MWSTKKWVIIWKQNTRNKLPSPHLPSPCIHINVRNEIIWSKKFKIVWKQNTRKKFPFPCYHPHALIPHSHPHATVPMLPWGQYRVLASVPMFRTQSSHPHAPIPKLPNRHFTISMLPSQHTKPYYIHLLFFSELFQWRWKKEIDKWRKEFQNDHYDW